MPISWSPYSLLQVDLSWLQLANHWGLCDASSWQYNVNQAGRLGCGSDAPTSCSHQHPLSHIAYVVSIIFWCHLYGHSYCKFTSPFLFHLWGGDFICFTGTAWRWACRSLASDLNSWSMAGSIWEAIGDGLTVHIWAIIGAIWSLQPRVLLRNDRWLIWVVSKIRHIQMRSVDQCLGKISILMEILLLWRHCLATQSMLAPNSECSCFNLLRIGNHKNHHYLSYLSVADKTP